MLSLRMRVCVCVCIDCRVWVNLSTTINALWKQFAVCLRRICSASLLGTFVFRRSASSPRWIVSPMICRVWTWRCPYMRRHNNFVRGLCRQPKPILYRNFFRPSIHISQETKRLVFSLNALSSRWDWIIVSVDYDASDLIQGFNAWLKPLFVCLFSHHQDINDSEDVARQLGALMSENGRRDKVTVNLIPYNVTDVPEAFEAPTCAAVEQMQHIITHEFNVRCYTRTEMGQVWSPSMCVCVYRVCVCVCVCVCVRTLNHRPNIPHWLFSIVFRKSLVLAANLYWKLRLHLLVHRLWQILRISWDQHRQEWQRVQPHQQQQLQHESWAVRLLMSWWESGSVKARWRTRRPHNIRLCCRHIWSRPSSSSLWPWYWLLSVDLSCKFLHSLSHYHSNGASTFTHHDVASSHYDRSLRIRTHRQLQNMQSDI